MSGARTGARTYPQVNIRVPQELYQWLQDAAQRNFRSVAAETAYQLDQLRQAQLQEARQ